MSERGPVYYDEAQVNRWLAWLAHNMQRHDQTVFLIENLQPSWLQTRGEVRAFSLTTRVIWGVWAALICELFFGLTVLLGMDFLLPNMLFFWLYFGVLFGSVFGLVDTHKLQRDFSESEAGVAPSTGRFVFGVLRIVLAVMLMIGLIVWLSMTVSPTARQISDLIYWLTIVLAFVLVFGLLYSLRSLFRTASTEIHTVEMIAWSRFAALKSGSQGCFFGLVVGLIVGLVPLATEETVELMDKLIVGLIFGVVGALIFGLIFGLIGGFTLGLQGMKSEPNQGIWLSLRNATLIGGSGGLAIGIISGVVGRSTGEGMVASFVYGLVMAIALGSWFGGIDVAEHAVLRFILVGKDYTPLNYARFLDYAVDELNLLQRVGGGYMFIHRYLLEYFAGMYETVDPVLKPLETDSGTHSERVIEPG